MPRHPVDSVQGALVACRGSDRDSSGAIALARQLEVKLVTTDDQILEQFPAVAVSLADF
jgi:hypothetical protein